MQTTIKILKIGVRNLSCIYYFRIETSCDETAAAIYQTSTGVIANKLFSQISLQERYGAVSGSRSRSHLEKIGPIIQERLIKHK